MRYLIKNSSIIDPSQRVINLGHILVEDSIITRVFDLAELTPDMESPTDDLEVINAQACVVTPGFTDLHTHLGESGSQYYETIASGTLAAARGGFTTLCATPTSLPPHDTRAAVHHMQDIAQTTGHVKVDMIGAVTRERQGKVLTDMAELAKAGCIAFSDDDQPIQDPVLIRNALSYASMLDMPLFCHCEQSQLNVGWAMHEGVVSTRLGLSGYPSVAEESQIACHIALAEMTRARLHICSVSTAGGVALIRRAKERGVRVTADVNPHHLALTDEWVMGFLNLFDHENPIRSVKHSINPLKKTRKLDTQELKKPLPVQKLDEHNLRSPLWLDSTILPPFDSTTRINPPLRTQDDVEALLVGLSDNTIDAIATNHAPHDIIRTNCPYQLMPCGVSSLETALGLVMSLVSVGAIDLMNVIAKFTEGPAEIFGRAPSTLKVGTSADIVILNPEKSWIVDSSNFASLGKNTPLEGQQLKGQIELTMCDGKIVFRREGFGKNAQGRPKASVLPGILSNDDEEEEGEIL